MEFESSKKMHVIMRRMRNEEEQLRNHLLSIQRDSSWVTQTQDLFNGIPLIANLRNGEWYGNQWEAYSYFKSGDGHNNEWNFSFTRLNLHIALLAAEKSGCIIVDSTRRGKQYPDSFYATVPLWCGVLNTLIFGSASGIIHSQDEAVDSIKRSVSSTDKDENKNISDFVGPPWMPISQHSAIQSVISKVIAQMPEYLQEYIRALLSEKLLKPLQPVWVSPVDGMLDVQGDEAACESVLSSSHVSSNQFVPVILLSVSEERSEREHREEGFSWFYVKGAGDDQENWCRGLTPSDFWTNEEDILSSDDPGCVDEVVDKLVASGRRSDRRVMNLCTTYSSFGKSFIFNNHQQVVSGDSPSAPQCFDAIIYVDVRLDASHDGGVADHEWAPALVGGENVLYVELLSQKKKLPRGEVAWQEIFSSCLLFYTNICKSKRGNLSLVGTLPRLLVFSSCEACDDAQTAITTALLLCFFDVYFDKMLETSDMRRRSEDVAKVDVQIWSGLVQSKTPKSALSRSLLKELNAFFISGKGIGSFASAVVRCGGGCNGCSDSRRSCSCSSCSSRSSRSSGCTCSSSSSSCCCSSGGSSGGSSSGSSRSSSSSRSGESNNSSSSNSSCGGSSGGSSGGSNISSSTSSN